MSDRTCSIDGCSRAHRAKGYCKMHYYALRPETCSVVGCSGRLKAKGFCNQHYRQGDEVCEYCREGFRGDRRRRFCSTGCRIAFGLAQPVEYFGVHRRIKVQLGSARLFDCVDCGGTASHWSYNYGDPDQLISTKGTATGIPYSLRAEFYEPRCAHCHKIFDSVQRIR